MRDKFWEAVNSEIFGILPNFLPPLKPYLFGIFDRFLRKKKVSFYINVFERGKCWKSEDLVPQSLHKIFGHHRDFFHFWTFRFQSLSLIVTESY